MKEGFIRDILYFEAYYLDFYEKLKPNVKKKFNWTLQLIATLEKIPENILSILLDLRGFLKLGLKLVLIYTRCSVFLIRIN
ncbi:hypothetical protein SAMN04488511_106177 [Pedobacter suwonensis]|uniref:Uncharacterized protein n=1 Tax=Pedobacter suwonensis TaxID=332999 RepID=A0A1I0T602_9SPHI|nr:hypothetical protein SAMN04488511_106177 [Pedobacter suwonensis]